MEISFNSCKPLPSCPTGSKPGVDPGAIQGILLALQDLDLWHFDLVRSPLSSQTGGQGKQCGPEQLGIQDQFVAYPSNIGNSNALISLELLTQF